MKICVTSQGDNLDSQVDPRFGRCAYFIFVDTENMKFEAVQNTDASGMSGVGVQTAQMVANKGVETVLTGNVGPNAFQTLQAGGLDIITGVSGIVKDVIEKYKKGELKPVQAPSVGSKFGVQG
jgi:predicted Fe-Mo cluster-binding NifX family protein